MTNDHPLVAIVPYRPQWPADYAAIAARLAQGLGRWALRLDHIGSTAVPGIAAKDVIDVMISVASLAEEAPWQSALIGLGYQLVPAYRRDHRPPGAAGPDGDWEQRYFRPPAGQRPTHVHVRVQGRPNWRYALLFRDFLRARPDTAAAFAEAKRRLAAGLRPERGLYAVVKDPMVDLIYLAAEAWAEHEGWRPA